ncbi:unnamed protein product [Victoria cruziana]
MEVKYRSTTIVRPEKVLHKQVPLTVFDKAATDLHIQVLLVYKPGAASNDRIKDALSEVLTHYPMLVGELSYDGFPAVYIDDESGVPVTETAVAGDLEDFLPFEPSPALAVLCPEAQGTNPLLMVQLNRFDCGGLVMGVSCNHKIHDGQAISNFFVSWSEMVRDQPVRVLPVHDQSLLRPRNPPAPQFPHEDMEFCTVAAPDHDAPPPRMLDGPIENVVVHYSGEFLKKLKERTGSKHSTFVCMLAHLWKKATVAREVADEEVTSAKVSVNGRPRLGITGAYFGNLVLTAFPTAMAKDVVEEPLGRIADLIGQAVEKVGRDYFQSVIDFGELNKDKELCPSVGYMEGNTLCPDLEVDSWLGFQFHKVDMGGGAPCAFLPTWIPVEGILILIPSPTEDKDQELDQRWGAGIDVILTLSEEHARTFKQIAHSLD